MNQESIHNKKASMKRRKTISKTTAYVILTILSIIWIVPLIWLIIQSFAAPERYDNGVPISTYDSERLFPQSFSLIWYEKLFTETSYLKWFGNTFLIAMVCLVLSTFFTIAMAYVMSRFRFKSRKKLQSVAMILGMFPGFMSMAAIYQIFNSVGLAGANATNAGRVFSLILVYSGSAGLNYYVSKGFFDTVSKSLDEAARIDGATNAQIFAKIILPLSKPIIVYTALMSFLAPWGDFIFSSYLLGTNKEAWTVSVGLYDMLTGAKGNNIIYQYNMFMAGAVLIALPATILFLCLQRYFVEGITGGAVKG